MMKRTTVILDTELVSEVGQIFGTAKASETLRRALEDVVRRKRLKSLSQWNLDGMTLDSLEESRRGRNFSL